MVGGDFWGFMIGRPIALGVLALAFAALLLPLAQTLWRRAHSDRAEA